MFGYFGYSHFPHVIFLPLSEEPKTDISLPRDKLPRAKEVKERKKVLRENRQNAEMERAARHRTGLYPATSLPALSALGPQLPPAVFLSLLQC